MSIPLSDKKAWLASGWVVVQIHTNVAQMNDRAKVKRLAKLAKEKE